MVLVGVFVFPITDVCCGMASYHVDAPAVSVSRTLSTSPHRPVIDVTLGVGAFRSEPTILTVEVVVVHDVVSIAMVALSFSPNGSTGHLTAVPVLRGI